ncbi:MAG: hypothetical protein H6671_00795 [Anaerolineaceae bacterium]|nr:hypothetical protein [Anaerolineaceae bacterium]
MSEHTGANDPKWLDEFEQLANEQLGHGSSCEQVHPIVEQWFNQLMNEDPPESRDSVAQAMACLSTEILYTTPQQLRDILMQHITEDDLALWIEHVLLVGRAFEIALNDGKLDDL